MLRSLSPWELWRNADGRRRTWSSRRERSWPCAETAGPLFPPRDRPTPCRPVRMPGFIRLNETLCLGGLRCFARPTGTILSDVRKNLRRIGLSRVKSHTIYAEAMLQEILVPGTTDTRGIGGRIPPAGWKVIQVLEIGLSELCRGRRLPFHDTVSRPATGTILLRFMTRVDCGRQTSAFEKEFCDACAVETTRREHHHW